MAKVMISSCITGEQIEAEENFKKVRKLKKQLREIEILEEKQLAGEVLAKEQLEKVKRKNEIFSQIKDFED